MNNTKPATLNDRRFWQRIGDVVMVVIGLVWLAPLVFAILMSVRPPEEPVSTGNIFVGSTVTTENYEAALKVAPWPLHLLNSVTFAAGVLLVQLFTVTFAGYAFARLTFPGRNLLLLLVLMQIMIPVGVLLVQNFATIRTLKLFDTQLALMIPYWGSAFGVLLLRQTFREVPFELEEAARIDGATWWQVMWNVYIPLSIPAYVSFAIVSISSHWNEFLWPFIVTRSEEVRPLTVGLNKLFSSSEIGANYGQLMAGTIIVIAPLFVLFLIFQRRFIESFATSGMK